MVVLVWRTTVVAVVVLQVMKRVDEVVVWNFVLVMKG